MRRARIELLAAIASVAIMSGCTGNASGAAKNDAGDVLASRRGLASYYGRAFAGEITASGRRFNPNHMVAAHPRWPFGTMVRVTNLDNGRSVVVRVIDRGPRHDYVREGVIIDVSQEAARRLRFVEDGRIAVKLDVLEWGDNERTSPPAE